MQTDIGCLVKKNTLPVYLLSVDRKLVMKLLRLDNKNMKLWDYSPNCVSNSCVQFPRVDKRGEYCALLHLLSPMVKILPTIVAK